MTYSQACRPCAKRKVRCDKLEPCSNCRRRKTDQCTYPPRTPSDHIRQLEGLVRELVHFAPTDGVSSSRDGNDAQQGIRAISGIRSSDPMLVEEDGTMQYLESRSWRPWRAESGSDQGVQLPGGFTTIPPPKLPHALVSVLPSHNTRPITDPPVDAHRARVLWDTFKERVEPLVRVVFRWQIGDLVRRTMCADSTPLSNLEQSLVDAIYYASANSLTDDQCMVLLKMPKSTLLAHCQTQCEQSLLGPDLFCVKDILTIKAVIFYIIASIGRLSTQSLWSIVGMTLRNAEKLGLHRDGLLLGLAPIHVEDRRRVWWQLQHLDLALAVRIGLTPMTLSAGWDVEMPSNIEDDDITPACTSIPRPRAGLTTMSYCLFTYWVLKQQRQTFLAKYGHFELSWQINSKVKESTKDDMMTQLETGINQEFLQYCDPIKPLDVFLQLFARLFITSMHLRILHARVFSGNGDYRPKLLESSTQTLRYNIAIQSQSSLKQFRWLSKAWFNWQAFMCVLIEARDAADMIRAQELWKLMLEVYAAHEELLDFAGDRRRVQAAEIILATWHNHEEKFAGHSHDKPDMLSKLSLELATYRAGLEPLVDPATRSAENISLVPDMPVEATAIEADFSFDLDFQDVDWSFWDSME